MTFPLEIYQYQKKKIGAGMKSNKKYTLSYSLNEGIQGGILGTVGRKALTREKIIREIEKHIFSEEWNRWLKEIKISIKKSGQ